MRRLDLHGIILQPLVKTLPRSNFEAIITIDIMIGITNKSKEN